jgi:hypothetical protein
MSLNASCSESISEKFAIIGFNDVAFDLINGQF